ncbi:MAG: glutaredoxin family protein [Streptosporangiales bacterium]|nr:glutaredoxin family protein [Streptosporangiales bacterium]MBO0890404.1 glutaredoxin family protein [Acidothermales bacterium]
MTKAWLSRRGVEFDDFNVQADPDALEELQARGIMTVPAVVVGDRWMTGWNPGELGELVGMPEEESPVSPVELVTTVRLVLDAAIRAASQVPDDRWEMTHPRRERPLRELMRHLFHVVEVSVDADVLGVFPAQRWLNQIDVPTMTGRARLLRYGEAVRHKFDVWYAVVDTDMFERVIDADVGPRTLNQVLERTRLHAGQHLRQVYAFLEMCDVTPEAPVSEADLRRLGFHQLPDEVF